MLFEQLFCLLLRLVLALCFNNFTAVLQGCNVDTVLQQHTSNLPRSQRTA